MLGMHGSVYGNRAVRDCDLLLAFGVRFDDRVTGKLEAFAKHAKIIHIDIDPSELNKNKPAHIPIVSDVKYALERTEQVVSSRCKQEIAAWVDQCQQWKADFPFKYNEQFDGILQQHAISQLWQEDARSQDDHHVGRRPASDVGRPVLQVHVTADLAVEFRTGHDGIRPARRHGCPGAHSPTPPVVDIDGDGSFQMNIQELATCYCEELPVKVLLLNNQHLGMVVQWEDRFMSGNRAHTYLGPIHHAEARGNGLSAYAAERYPDFVTIAKGYGCGGARVSKKADLDAALDEMLGYQGPFVLDVQVPYVEHVLPMIPSGHTVDDIIWSSLFRMAGPGGSAQAHEPVGHAGPVLFNDLAQQSDRPLFSTDVGEQRERYLRSSPHRYTIGHRGSMSIPGRWKRGDDHDAMRCHVSMLVAVILLCAVVVQSGRASPCRGTARPSARSNDSIRRSTSWYLAMPGSRCWPADSSGRKARSGSHKTQCLLFSDIPRNQIVSWNAQGKASAYFASRAVTRQRRSSPGPNRAPTA